jgi:hypothetical protein
MTVLNRKLMKVNFFYVLLVLFENMIRCDCGRDRGIKCESVMLATLPAEQKTPRQGTRVSLNTLFSAKHSLECLG